jgi:hypothetical protein
MEDNHSTGLSSKYTFVVTTVNTQSCPKENVPLTWLALGIIPCLMSSPRAWPSLVMSTANGLSFLTLNYTKMMGFRLLSLSCIPLEEQDTMLWAVKWGGLHGLARSQDPQSSSQWRTTTWVTLQVATLAPVKSSADKRIYLQVCMKQFRPEEPSKVDPRFLTQGGCDLMHAFSFEGWLRFRIIRHIATEFLTLNYTGSMGGGWGGKIYLYWER